MADWIDSFMEATEGLSGSTPPSFRLWGAITTIAATLERRVWTHTDVDPLYPNLYTILCGGPASGKTIMVKESRKILAPIEKLFLGPDTPTRESFLDKLQESTKTTINGTGMKLYAAMTVLCEEFGVLLPTYNDAFLSTLAKLYDNGPLHTEPRRDKSRDVTIENPTVNILAAATPDAIGKFPESAWGEGFASRLIFIYGVKPKIIRNMLRKREVISLEVLQKQAREMFNDLHGEFDWEQPAKDAINHWYNEEGQAPVPTYGRLLYYNGRRAAHVMKLSMISAVSAQRGLTVTLKDFERGKDWLVEAEKTMPDVFRAMGAKSDTQLLQDCHRHFYILYRSVPKERRKPIEEKDIWRFYEEKVTSDRIPKLIDAGEKTGRFKKSGFSHFWIPAAIDPNAPEPTP